MTQTQGSQIPLREYETIYVMRGDVPRDAAEKVATRVEEVVGREGGKLTQVESWGRRMLAYPVAKQRRGVYVYVKYVGQGPVVSELERNLRMLEPVLKYQTVLVRDDVEPNSVEVDPDRVKFEAVEPSADDEAEETLERRLGLDGGHFARHERHSDDNDDDDDDDVILGGSNRGRGGDANDSRIPSDEEDES